MLDDGVERVSDLPRVSSDVGDAERCRRAEGRQVQLQRELHMSVNLFEKYLVSLSFINTEALSIIRPECLSHLPQVERGLLKPLQVDGEHRRRTEDEKLQAIGQIQ